MEINDNPITSIVSDPYYLNEFQKIHDSDDTYKGKWNWNAFLFSGLWALHKKCWVLFILFARTASLLTFKFYIHQRFYINFSFAGLFWALLMGYSGNWFYYARMAKRRQPPF